MNDRPNLLDALGGEGRSAFEAQAESVSLDAGSTLFRQDEPSDALYLLMSGSLGVYAQQPDGDTPLLALIRPGETVGEMGVMTGQPRTATVSAIRDSRLLRLTRTQFDALQKDQPGLMAAINRILIHRLRSVTSGEAYTLEPKTIALLPAHAGVDIAPLAEQLARQLEGLGLRVKGVEVADAGRSAEWFAEQEVQFDFVLMRASAADEAWQQLCARQADRIMVIAKGNEEPCCDLAAGLLRQRSQHQLTDLVLLHDARCARPDGTAAWLHHIEVHRHFHICMERQKDLMRLARIVSGRSVGLVLSGGGARAYAHLGVLRAFEEAGVNIDFIAGASMGAIIAAATAAGADVQRLSEVVRASFVESNPLSDYTLPIVSLVRGGKVKRLLESHFGSLEIPDTWLPFYCVSANLTTGRTKVHRAGRVSDALRASIALPGILPPVITPDGVLADGAVIDNLPVAVMRGMHRGVVVAVDVARDLALDPEWLRREVSLSPLGRLLRPPIIPILMRAGTISSDEQNRRQSELADLIIQPPLGDIDLRDWKAFDRTVEIGYRHTREVLAGTPDALKAHLRVPAV